MIMSKSFYYQAFMSKYYDDRRESMAGITTSESMSGEQPKDDNLGSRVDELERVITGLQRILNDFLSRIEALEKEINDE